MLVEKLPLAEKLHSVEQRIVEQPEIVGLQSYEYLRNNEHGQRSAFMDSETLELTLDYPRLNSGEIGALAHSARGILLSLGHGIKSEKTESLYQAIEYRYAEMSLIDLAAQMNDTSLPEEERLEAVEWFKATNEALYGKPDQGTFNFLVQEKIQKLTSRDYQDQTAVTIRDELSSLIGHVDGEIRPSYTPSPATLERISRLVKARFEDLVSHIDSEKTYIVPEIADILDEALVKLGAKELGWSVVVAKDSSALATSPHQKLVEVGENRKAIIGADLKGKVMHEIGIHALRSINAEKAGWLSAAYGQEGYLAFEEAAATALEDAYNGKFANHGEDYYLIAGLAYGLDSHEPRDFREVYEIMWRKNVLSTSEITDETISKAKSKAFTNCMRMFRGTTTKDKGVIYSKDLAYFVGQELAWDVLDSTEADEDFELLLAGKLDLTKDEHRAIAKQIITTNSIK